MGLVKKCLSVILLLQLFVIGGCNEHERNYALEVSELNFTLLLEGEALGHDGYREELEKLINLADSNNPIAQERYADILLRTGNKKEAIRYLESAISLDYTLANETLGAVYFDSGKRGDLVKSIEYFLVAAEGDIASSQTFLALCFKDKDCKFPNNRYLANYWLSRAISNKEPSATFFADELESIEYTKDKTEQESQKVIRALKG